MAGGYSEHNFKSGNKDAYCRRCGAAPGSRSSCVGVYSDHDFGGVQVAPAAPSPTNPPTENAQTTVDPAPLPSNIPKADSTDFLPPTKEVHFNERDTPGVSILFLAADPSDASRLRLGEEYREIEEKLRQSKQRNRFTLERPQLSARPADISQAMLDTEPQIVHFSGHGTTTGALCFEDKLGQTQLVRADALAALFEHFSHQVQCVLLALRLAPKRLDARQSLGLEPVIAQRLL